MSAVIDPELSDAAIVERSRRSPDMFGVLYDRYASQLYRFAYRRVGPDFVEDVVAETFLAAFSRRDSYDVSRRDARSWLFGIVTREIARRHRAERTRYRALARLLSCSPLTGRLGYQLARLAEQIRQSTPASPLGTETPLPLIEARPVVDGNLAETALMIKPTGQVVRPISVGPAETGQLSQSELDAIRLILRYPHQDHSDPLIGDGYEVTIDDQPPIQVAAGDGELSARCPELAAVVNVAERTAS